MFLDITPDLLAESDVLGHGAADDLVKGFDVRRHGYREEKHKTKDFKMIWEKKTG